MRGFGDAERERIREQLRETGRDLFARYGLDKTTVADLTDPAGIATGTFYRFYDSKAELYYDVLREEGERLAEDIVAESFEAHDDPEEAIVAFLTLLCDEMETNPLVRRLVADDDMRRLTEQFGDGEMAAERDESLSYLRPFIEEWQEEGRLRDGDPDALAGVLGVAKFVPYHREDFRDEEYYREVRDAFIETLAAGLVRME
ncbi:TetR/AcrR family transcriptional regulator [Halorussus salilacus]|uniref:TetR/AcrR family transcriptional regulator n=1 Tax=Halorussus salilacus TaxID=2953750 RepID=UPI0020A116F9|nr:TetR/AcrR family transcriptional regulator [Halorussus salilacus]USZ69162.1 TetR/AcrR family transcriptional regulator [Halorussus salilacus]